MTDGSNGCLERTDFPATPAAVRSARHQLMAFLGEAVSEDASATAGLLASELATNAVMHAHTPFTLSVSLAPTSLRVGVEDGSVDLPSVRQSAPGATGGRGLYLVEELSSRWGAERWAGGKQVWFELPRW